MFARTGVCLCTADVLSYRPVIEESELQVYLGFGFGSAEDGGDGGAASDNSKSKSKFSAFLRGRGAHITSDPQGKNSIQCAHSLLLLPGKADN